MKEFIVDNWGILDALLVAVGLVIYVTASQAMHQRRHPSAAFAWVMGILLFPYLTIPLYLAFGSRKIIAHRVVKSTRITSDKKYATNTTAGRTKELAKAMGLPPPVSYQDLNIHENGTAALEALRQIIDHAEHSLDISTFLIGRNVLGEDILERLRYCATRGVKVRFLIDGIGIYMGKYPDLTPLIASGAEVVRFVPPFRSSRPGRTNLRNHRKMIIADEKHLWCGGRNLSAEYFEGDPRPILGCAPWVDLSFDLTGNVVQEAQQQFEMDWAFATEKQIPNFPPIVSEDGFDVPLAQLVDSGPDRPDDTLFTLLISACFTSRQHILAVSPYFVLDNALTTSLMLAARRGIQVDIVLPEHSNHKIADFARHRMLRDIVNAGGYVWLYPKMIHAKAVLVDDELALVGSANLDGRSLFLNYEMMLAFYDRQAVNRFAKWVENCRKECTPYVVRQPGVFRGLLEGIVLWLGFQL